MCVNEMDLRNFKKTNQQCKSDQNCDSKSDLTKFKLNSEELSSLAMSHLSSLPMNPFAQLGSVSQLLGKFVDIYLVQFDFSSR